MDTNLKKTVPKMSMFFFMQILKNTFFFKKTITFAPRIALLCNGSTADSGSVCMGSNPIGATTFLIAFLPKKTAS